MKHWEDWAVEIQRVQPARNKVSALWECVQPNRYGSPPTYSNMQSWPRLMSCVMICCHLNSRECLQSSHPESTIITHHPTHSPRLGEV